MEIQTLHQGTLFTEVQALENNVKVAGPLALTL